MNRLQFLYLVVLAGIAMWTWYFVDHAEEWGLPGPWPIDMVAGIVIGLVTVVFIGWLMSWYIKLGE